MLVKELVLTLIDKIEEARIEGMRETSVWVPVRQAKIVAGYLKEFRYEIVEHLPQDEVVRIDVLF